MAYLVPSELPSDCNSMGEQIMFRVFKGLNTDWIVLHSYFFSQHPFKQSAEVDFVVLAPGLGIFSLEVKHGRVARNKGEWIYGKTKTHKDPFKQASDNMFGLKKLIEDKTSKIGSNAIKKRIKKLMHGWGVLFTSMRKEDTLSLVEGSSGQILTRSDIRNVEAWIQRLSEKWQEKFQGAPWFSEEDSLPTKEDCEAILHLLRGDFEHDYGPINKALDMEQQIELFTREQFNVLEASKYNDRCLIQGGAGTGKTVLALELLQQRIKNGERVAFFVYNKLLADNLREKVGRMNLSEEQYEVSTMHSFMMKHVDKEELREIPERNQKFFSFDLPILFQLSWEMDSQKPFDYLIIDEAQDLLTEEFLDAFDLILDGGIKSGKWCFFGDFSNQILYRQGERPLELLSKYAFTNVPPLRYNCRNTVNITKELIYMTGAEDYERQDGVPKGAPVNYSYCKSRQDLINQVESIISELKNGGEDLRNLSILSPTKDYLESIGKENFWKNLAFKDKPKLETIHSFKGLESRYVILLGFEDLEDYTVRSLLYVGYSRAKVKLFVLLHEKLKNIRKKLVENNYEKVVNYG